MEILYRISHTSFSQSSNSLCLLVSEKIFLNFSQSEARIAHGNHIFLFNQDDMRKVDREPSIDASCKLLHYLAKWFQRRFLEIDEPETRIAYGGRLCKQMNNINRGHSIDASYPVSVHLIKLSQRRRFFRNWPTRNKNCLRWPCLLTDRDELSNFYRLPSIYASYKVSVHLAKRFQRRRCL